MNAPEQLTFFSPTGREVIELALRHARESERLQAAARTMEERGMHGVARGLCALAAESFDRACEMEMLAEFERLGGVTEDTP